MKNNLTALVRGTDGINFFNTVFLVTISIWFYALHQTFLRNEDNIKSNQFTTHHSSRRDVSWVDTNISG